MASDTSERSTPSSLSSVICWTTDFSTRVTRWGRHSLLASSMRSTQFSGDTPPLIPSEEAQVRSLTQFYSVGFSQSRIGVEKFVIINAHNQGLRQVFLTVAWEGPLCLARHTWRCPCFSVVPEATHEASRGPLKGAVSAQKALQGSETETRELLGGTEEKSATPTHEAVDLPFRQINDFFCCKKLKLN